ncbi:hypothetical protein HMPREF1494_2032 [Bifidobacterium sp. MSTE12]|nr:hypothetical protein HMPREF1494_2032 [Bifidobacterium sp. MSTE12]
MSCGETYCCCGLMLSDPVALFPLALVYSPAEDGGTTGMTATRGGRDEE